MTTPAEIGIVEVDPATMERIPKASAIWYADVACGARRASRRRIDLRGAIK